MGRLEKVLRVLREKGDLVVQILNNLDEIQMIMMEGSEDSVEQREPVQSGNKEEREISEEINEPIKSEEV